MDYHDLYTLGLSLDLLFRSINLVLSILHECTMFQL